MCSALMGESVLCPLLPQLGDHCGKEVERLYELDVMDIYSEIISSEHDSPIAYMKSQPL